MQVSLGESKEAASWAIFIVTACSQHLDWETKEADQLRRLEAIAKGTWGQCAITGPDSIYKKIRTIARMDVPFMPDAVPKARYPYPSVKPYSASNGMAPSVTVSEGVNGDPKLSIGGKHTPAVFQFPSADMPCLKAVEMACGKHEILKEKCGVMDYAMNQLASLSYALPDVFIQNAKDIAAMTIAEVTMDEIYQPHPRVAPAPQMGGFRVGLAPA